MKKCFLCDPTVLELDAAEPPNWAPLRSACWEHASLARLPDGQVLVDVADASEESLEGPGLGFLFNPVDIEGRTCWTTWWSGSFAVHPMVYESANYFEFIIQHLPERVNVLYQIYQHREVFGSEVTTDGYVKLLTQMGKGSYEGVDWLIRFWWRQQVYSEVLRSLSQPCASSAAEAMALIRKHLVTEMPTGQMWPAIAAVLELAEKRFR